MTIPKYKIDNLVLNYFIQNGFDSAAKTFASEIGVDLDDKNYNPLTKGYSTITQRKEIKKLLLLGKVTECIKLISSEFPSVLDSNNLLHFKLLKLNLIEMIRNNYLITGTKDSNKDFFSEILSFVRENLISKVSSSYTLLKELEITMSLLCFNFDPSRPLDDQNDLPKELKDLFDLSLRNQCYLQVNKYILQQDNSNFNKSPQFTDFDFSKLPQVSESFALMIIPGREDIELNLEEDSDDEPIDTITSEDLDQLNANLQSKLQQVINQFDGVDKIRREDNVKSEISTE